jgi:hypothetical protein
LANGFAVITTDAVADRLSVSKPQLLANVDADSSSFRKALLDAKLGANGDTKFTTQYFVFTHRWHDSKLD